MSKTKIVIIVSVVILVIILSIVSGVIGYKYEKEGGAFFDCAKVDPIGCIFNSNISTDCNKYGKTGRASCLF